MQWHAVLQQGHWIVPAQSQTVVNCQTVDDSACHKNLCDSKTGACKTTAVNAGGGCDDGDPCSSGEVCQAGACVASAFTCQCKTDGDCAPQDDGDLCNGTLYCDKQSGTCKLNAATVVSCPSVADGVCLKNLCSPKTGLCALTPVFEGKACDDGNSCSKGEVCSSGQCVGTNTCQCQGDGDCASKEDGNLCNGTLYCEKITGQCQINPATVKNCATATDTACKTTSCDPKTGLCGQAAAWNGAQCDADGNPCTAYDYCDDGACKIGQNVCQCSKDSDCAGAAAGNLCVLQMACDPILHKCSAVKAVVCNASQDTPCQKNVCTPKTGTCALDTLDDATLCGDSKLCTASKVCSAGLCVAGKALSCGDTLPCTVDKCDDKSGCVHTAVSGGPCNDGSLCTKSETCVSGACLGTASDCSDSSPCTDDACDPKLGCVHLPGAVTACSDGNPCTLGDSCSNGKCTGGLQKPDCDDKLACTDDSCVATQGCVHKGNTGGSCSDGSLCTKSDSCAGGQCVGTPLACDDGNGCTVDSCDASSGCIHAGNVGQPCTDGNACTGPDACTLGGNCTGKPVPCDDKNPCTLDTCNIGSGCLPLALSAVDCDDGDSCTAPDACQSGTCKGKPLGCDDQNPCTADTCTKGQCANSATTGVCSDGNPCSVDDTCTTGKCVGKVLICDDANTCTTEVCIGGSCLFGNTANGLACDDGDDCTNSLCAAGTCLGTPKLWQTTLPGVQAVAVTTTATGSAVVGTIAGKPWINWLGPTGKNLGGLSLGFNSGAVTGVASLGPSGLMVVGEAGGANSQGWIAVYSAPLVGKAGKAYAATVGSPALPVRTFAGVSSGANNTAWVAGGALDGSTLRGIVVQLNAEQLPLRSMVAAKDTAQTFEVAVPFANNSVLALGSSKITAGIVRNWRVIFGADGAVQQSVELAAADNAQGLAAVRLDDHLWTTVGPVVTAFDANQQAVWTRNLSNLKLQMALVPLMGNRLLGLASNGALMLMRPDSRVEWNKPVPLMPAPLLARAADGTLIAVNADSVSRWDAFGNGLCGACLAESATMCDDNKPCTFDNCLSATGCTNLKAVCDDSNPCTGGECTPEQGCSLALVASTCDDGNPCTAGDMCTGMSCGGATASCPVGPACTLASCSMVSGCYLTAVAAGNPCGIDKICVGTSLLKACVSQCSAVQSGGTAQAPAPTEPLFLLGPKTTKTAVGFRLEMLASGPTDFTLQLLAPSGKLFNIVKGECGAVCSHLGAGWSLDVPNFGQPLDGADGGMATMLANAGSGQWKIKLLPLTDNALVVKSWKLTLFGPCN